MRKQRFKFRFAALPVASLIIMSASFAAPAAPEGAPLRSQFSMGSLLDRTILPVIRTKGSTPPTHLNLDLRAPEVSMAPDAYPAMPSNHALRIESENGLSFQLPMAKPMSPAEAFATRVHREGVPLARVWENKSTLVSVGFNQKGHLGLWLIQKTH
jgi:hypothetical protein